MGLSTPPSGLAVANALPDGSVVWTDTAGDVGRVVELLREYDPDLRLVRNNRDERWEVWLGNQRICRRDGMHVPDGHKLVAFIAAHDTRRGFDPIADVDRHNAAVDRARDQEAAEVFEDKADRLAHALGKDLDLPAQDGRLYPLSGA